MRSWLWCCHWLLCRYSSCRCSQHCRSLPLLLLSQGAAGFTVPMWIYNGDSSNGNGNGNGTMNGASPGATPTTTGGGEKTSSSKSTSKSKSKVRLIWFDRLN